MDADDGLRLDYEQTTQFLRTLVDVRFKLLAFVPTLTGAAVGLVGGPRPAAELERQLGLRSALGASGPGGLFGELPGRAVRLLGVLPVGQDSGLALVYSTALAGWTYLAAWGALGALEFGEARAIGAAMGVAAGLIVFAEVERVHRRSAEESSRPARRSPPA